MAKKKRVSTFTKAMLIYVLVFAALAAGALYFFYNYMAAYEVSGSKSCMKEYMSQLDAGIVPEGFNAELDKLDENVQSREETIRWLKGLLSEAGYVRVGSESGEDYETYDLISRGRKIGKVRVEHRGVEQYGLKMWELAEESYDLSGFMTSVSYFMPEDYTLQVGNARYSAGEETKEYKALDYVYDRYEGITDMHKFESGLYIDGAELKFLDAKGNEITEEQFTEQYFLNNCDEALEERLKTFGLDFMDRYVKYGSVYGGHDNFFVNFYNLKLVMLREGELYKRLDTEWGVLFYSSTVYCNILDSNVNICSQLADNLYLIDISYTTETKGFADAVVSDNFIRVVAVEDEFGNLMATNLYNY